MPFDIGALAQQTAGGVIGAGMGLLLEGHNDRRQLRQQGKLQELEIKGQKEMGIFNREQQMQMWRDTNYSAQMEEMKKAGINPALIYGQSGASGQSSANPGRVTGGQAPSGGRETMEGTAMGLQLAMIQAQIANTNADTKQKEVETAKTGGVDTAEANTRINSLTQGIENQKAIEQMTKVETELKKLELAGQQRSMEDRMDYIAFTAGKAAQELEIAMAEAYVARETQIQKRDIIRAEAIGAVLQNALTGAQTQNVKADTENKGEQFWQIRGNIQKMASDLMLGWEQLSVEQKRARIQQQAQLFTEDNYGLEKITDIIEQAVDGIFKRVPSGGEKIKYIIKDKNAIR